MARGDGSGGREKTIVIDTKEASRLFVEHFGALPQWVVRAPGRVNLIGEHTDYNDGFVMPLAIDRAVWIALRPRPDRRVVVRSIDFDDSGEFLLDQLRPSEQRWLEYIKGVAWSLAEDGLALSGWEGIVTGDVPAGAGLSSSAALEVAAARAFAAAAAIPWDAKAMAVRCQRAENRWVGMNCGIMDQMISACGRAGHAVLIDCRSLELSPAPLPDDVSVVVLDTGTRRGLVDSQYNARRADCEAACAALGVKALRDATLQLLDERRASLSETAFRRARHVISENERTVRAAEAMRSGDVDALGLMLGESHRSLRDDYEVSSPALDAIVDAATAHPACLGARMTGAGFGGCAVALVRSVEAADFARRTAARYRDQTGFDAVVHVCRATDGAAVEWTAGDSSH